MKNKMLLIDVENNIVKEVEAGGLDDYYEMLNCRCIDIVSRTIAGRRYEIICDDEGTFKEAPKISGVATMWSPMFVGNLLVASGLVEDGELTSLTEDDIKHIKKNIGVITTEKHPEPYQVLCNIDW